MGFGGIYLAILPLGHKPTQPQSPGEFVAGLSTSQVEVHRKLSTLHRLSREAGCVDASAEAQRIRCQLGTGTHVSWFYGFIQCQAGVRGQWGALVSYKGPI